MNIFRKKRLLQDLDQLIFYAIASLAFFLALMPFMASLSLGIGVFLYIIKIIASGKNRSFRRTMFDLPIAAFTLISGLSVAVSPDPAFSFYNYYNLVGRYVLTYLLVVQNVTTLRQIQQIVYALGLRRCWLCYTDFISIFLALT